MATWTGLSYSFGSLLTSTKMTQNQDNFLALAEGASGAPKIQTAALEQTNGAEAVTTATIRADAVTNTEIAANAVGTSEIAASAVGQNEIATNGVSSAEIVDGSVGQAEIATNGVSSAEIVDGSVGQAEIATNGVSSDEIAASAVGQSEIATDGVGAAEIAINVVAQAEIKEGIHEVSTNATFPIAVVPTGGSYTLWFQHKSNNASWNSTVGFPSSQGTTSATYQTVYITHQTGHSGALSYLRSYYISGSPPYDLGDGDAGLFIFAMMHGNEIRGISVSPDPVWAYNGPTNTMPDFTDKLGRKFKKVKKGLPFTIAEAKRDPGKLRELVQAHNTADWEYVLIDQEMKNRDQYLLPHPYIRNDLTDKQIILLDPVSDISHELIEFAKAGESVNDLIHDGYLQLDNTPINRAVPPGVIPAAFKWRNTG